MSILEFVIICFLPLFEEIGNCQNHKLSELEIVRVRNCQNRHLSVLETIRIGILTITISDKIPILTNSNFE